MQKNFWQNLLFAAAVLLLAGALAFWRAHRDAPGACARVTVEGCGEDILLSLAEDGRYSVAGGRLPVTLEVDGGRIRFIESRCPDHICEHAGWLSQQYDQAVCMPAGVSVTVER